MINQYSNIVEDDDDKLIKEEEKTPLKEMLKLSGFIILGIISITMIIFGFLTFAESLKVMKYKRVEAVVQKDYYLNDYEHNVTYKVDGKEYNNDIDIYQDLKENDKISIFYDPKNPEKIRINRNINYVSLLVGMAGIVLVYISFTKGFPLIGKTKAYFKQEDEDEE